MGVVKDDTPDPNVYLYPGNQGHSLAAVQGAVMAGALYPPARLVMLDVPQRPFCCAPMDSVLTRFVGASKSRSLFDQTWHEPLPGYVPTTEKAEAMAEELRDSDAVGKLRQLRAAS